MHYLTFIDVEPHLPLACPTPQAVQFYLQLISDLHASDGFACLCVVRKLVQETAYFIYAFINVIYVDDK
jgi:hypothetical protein